MNDKTKEMIEDLFALIKSQEKLIENLYKASKEDSKAIRELRNSNTSLDTEKAYELKYEALKGQFLAQEVALNKYKDMYHSVYDDRAKILEELDTMKYRVQNTVNHYEKLGKELI
jgi:hypothetical protein